MALSANYWSVVPELPSCEGKHDHEQCIYKPSVSSNSSWPVLPVFHILPAYNSVSRNSKFWASQAVYPLLNVIMLCFGALSIFFLLKSVLVTASVTQSQPRDATVDGSSWDYDVIVVGGGPAGLSALSGLARVHRKAFLIDSGEYRNSETRVGYSADALFHFQGFH